MGKKKKQSTKSEEIDLFDTLKNLKINIPIFLLVLFLLLGFYLRFYHIKYPLIGYHNWKNAHYITEARNFAREGFFKYGLFVPMRDTMESIDEQPDGAHGDTFPTISIIVGILFKIFGESIVVARLVGIIFSLLAVIAFYLLIKELFEKESLALIAAFLATINPLYVFFSHNIQLVNPGLFFMLLGAYYYVKWLKKQASKYEFKLLYVSILLIIFATLTKYPYGITVVPMIFSFPLKQALKHKKRFLKPIIICGLISLLVPLWYIYEQYYVTPVIYGASSTTNVVKSVGLTQIIDFSIIWDNSFWQIMKSYIADNFTLIGMTLAMLGMVLSVFLFATKNRTKIGYKFMIGYLVGLVFFLFIMGFKLSGHNYHQFYIAPLIIFLIAFFIEVIAKNISNMVKGSIRNIVYLFVVLLILFVPLSQGKGLIKHMEDSRDRMFNTQFPGLDVAGEYIKQNSLPNERLFHSSHQSFGVLWHADRKGYKPPKDKEYFKRAESDFNVGWVFVYQWGIQSYFQNQEVMDYIRNNYRLAQVGFIPVGNQAQPLYFLFRKGGTFNETQINSLIQDKPVYNRVYHYTHGPYEIRFVNLE